MVSLILFLILYHWFTEVILSIFVSTEALSSNCFPSRVCTATLLKKETLTAGQWHHRSRRGKSKTHRKEPLQAAVLGKRAREKQWDGKWWSCGWNVTTSQISGRSNVSARTASQPAKSTGLGPGQSQWVPLSGSQDLTQPFSSESFYMYMSSLQANSQAASGQAQVSVSLYPSQCLATAGHTACSR